MLKVENLQSGYGASKVLFGVDLEIQTHHVVSLLGRNGMGKTTTVRTLMGMLPVKGGQVSFDGVITSGMRPYAIARVGFGLVPEGRHVFSSLSVYENLVATQRNDHGNEWTLDAVYDLFPRLKERSSQSARTLSGGEQQMLAIGRALLTNPRLLILDEATEGLAPTVRQEIWDCLNRLKTQGQTILLIDKNLKEMHSLVDRHYIIEKGRIVWNGTSDELHQQPQLVQRYLGVA